MVYPLLRLYVTGSYSFHDLSNDRSVYPVALLYGVVLMAGFDIGFKLLVPAVDGRCQPDLMLFLNLNTCADRRIIFGQQHM